MLFEAEHSEEVTGACLVIHGTPEQVDLALYFSLSC